MLNYMLYAECAISQLANSGRVSQSERTKGIRLCRGVVPVLLGFVLTAVAGGSVWAADQTYVRALYYDNANTLLLIEDTTIDVDWTQRTLVNVNPPQVPNFDGSHGPTAQCNPAAPMAVPASAAFAIYYGRQGGSNKLKAFKREAVALLLHKGYEAGIIPNPVHLEFIG